MDDGSLRAEAAEEFFLLPDHEGIYFPRGIEQIHRQFQPKTYLEIGTLAGGTLRLAECASIAVDPRFVIDQDVIGNKPACLLMQMPSDAFFARYDPAALFNRPVDLAFLDGMHLFEFLLRDFINTERCCGPGSIILMHDCLPTDAFVARRELGDRRFEHLSPHRDWWAGDVWKTVVILQKLRPDLRLVAFDAMPTGLIGVTNLDPRSEVLSKHYFALTEHFRSAGLSQSGAETFMRLLDVQPAALMHDPPALAAALLGVRHDPPPAPARLPLPPQAAPPQPPRQAEPIEETRIDVHVFQSGEVPPPALANLWPRLQTLLREQREFNRDEARVQAQQQDMIRDGCLAMPSPFSAEPHSCLESYELGHRFWFRFRGGEEFFWVSGTVLNGFDLASIYFPRRRVAVTLRGGDISAAMLAEFETFRRTVAKPSPPAIPSAGRRTVVSGAAHYMHVLWNELPGLECAVTSGLSENMRVAAIYQPFGPIAALFPELADEVRQWAWHEVRALNARDNLLLGLGARSITADTRARLRRVAGEMAGEAVIAAREAFRSAHHPVFWLSVTPSHPTLRDQPAMLARLIATVKAEHPTAGFMVNGTSHPWDLETNPNYGDWYGRNHEAERTAASGIIENLLGTLDPDARAAVVVVTDVSVCDEIAWGEAADFYFCHGGTMQHKIGGIHEVPGMIHCANRDRERFRALQARMLDAPPCRFVPPELVADAEPDYAFRSPDPVGEAFLSAYRELASAGSPGDHAAETATEAVAVHAFALDNDPPPELADIWPRLAPLLRHARWINDDEARLREQQHGMIRDGFLSMPSPFRDEPHQCTASYHFLHRFYYPFAAEEEYVWISEGTGGAYALAAIFFPKRRLAVCLNDAGDLAAVIAEFEELRALVAKPEEPADPGAGRRVVLTGFPHYMHTLWNELPAIDHAARAGLGGRIALVAAYQPLGPLAEMFPEFDDVRLSKFDQSVALNAAERFLVGLGSRTITRTAQERLRGLATRLASEGVVAARDRFRAAYSPIFWFSVKAPGRTCLHQAEVLAHLIGVAKAAYPSAGFILNGTSHPWDMARNDNYGAWFLDGLKPQAAYAAEVIDDVLVRLPDEQRAAVRAVSDVPVCDEIVWGGAADFYFCHGGTMQNKIGWIHPVPGMVHGSNEFMHIWRYQAGVVEDGPAPSLVSSNLIADSEPERSTVFTKERRASNYTFTSLDALAAEFLEAARQALPQAGDTPSPSGKPRRKKRGKG